MLPGASGRDRSKLTACLASLVTNASRLAFPLNPALYLPARVVHFSAMVFDRRNLDWWCERGILTLVLAALVFAPLAFGAVYVWSFLVLQVLVLGVALVWLARLWGGHKPKLLWPPLAWAVAAFVLYALARYFTADIEYAARLELIRVLLYAFLFLAVLSNLYGQDSAETIAYTLTAVAALASSYALVQFAHHSNQVWNLISPYTGRAGGTYISPDHFAGFLELVLPLPLAFLLAGRVGVVTRVLLAYATLSILGGLTVTFSRGGWLAAAAGVLLLLGLLMCHRNHRLRAFLVLLVFCWRAGECLRRGYCPTPSPTSGAWPPRKRVAHRWWTRIHGCKCGRRRRACGATIPGGASGRATSIIGSANIARLDSSPGPNTPTRTIWNCSRIGGWPAGSSSLVASAFLFLASGKAGRMSGARRMILVPA